MKKILSILVCVCVLLSAMVLTVSAAETSATITFDNSSKAQWSSTQQLWTENGITVTNNKGASTTNIDVTNKYSNPARFYKDSDLIVEYPNMTKIVFVANTYKSTYATDLKNSCKTGTVSISSNVVTVVFDAPVNSYAIKMAAQVRMDSITVYAEAAGGNEPACTHANTTATSNGNETHKVVCDDCGETVTASVDCTDADVNGKCDVCPGDVAVPFDPTGKTAAEIVDAAYALESGKAFEKNATLTGEIINIDSPYSSQYKNIDVTIKVDGADANKPIKCYRLKGEGADTLAVGDKITVTGTIKNYNGTIEFDQGCTLDALVKGEGETPVAPENPKEIVDAAFALEAGKTLPYAATLTGKITNIEKINEQYGDVCLTIAVEGTDGEKELYCYNLKPTEGIDVNTLVVGDKITVTGNIKNYNGTIEFISCSFVMATDDGEGNGEGTGTTPPAGEGTGTGSTSGTTTGGTTTTTPEVKPNTDTSTTSPATGDNMGAVAMMAIAAAAVLVASKKR